MSNSQRAHVEVGLLQSIKDEMATGIAVYFAPVIAVAKVVMGALPDAGRPTAPVAKAPPSPPSGQPNRKIERVSLFEDA